MNRWSKNGVLNRVFEHLQRAQLVRIKLEAASLDSTIVKVRPIRASVSHASYPSQCPLTSMACPSI